MSCGTDLTQMRLIINSVIQEMLDNGKLQGGLVDCENNPLPAKRKIPECDDANKIKLEFTEQVTELKVLLAKLGVTSNTTKDESGNTRQVEAAFNRVELLLGELLRHTRTDGTTADITLPQIKDFEIKDNAITFIWNTGKRLTKSLCGWRGAQPCEYHATLNIRTAYDECGGNFSRVVYGFDPADLRDPLADVQLLDCNGNTLGYIYSTKGENHTVEYYADGKLIGYALTSPVVRRWDKSCCDGTGTLFDPPPPTATPNNATNPNGGVTTGASDATTGGPDYSPDTPTVPEPPVLDL